MRYVIATETGFAQFRWPWTARPAFKALPIQHGEGKVLMRFGRRGRAKVLAEEYAESPVEPNEQTIWCEEGKHDECKGWGETIFQVPRQRAKCRCVCHRQLSPSDEIEDNPPSPAGPVNSGD